MNEIFYHGTSMDAWNAIKKEGILFGIRESTANRCTYLTPDIEEAKLYGDTVLEVKYNPYKNQNQNNYIDGCWQFRVYEPIRIDNIKQV